MTYSSNNFSDDIVRCLVDAGVVDADAMQVGDIGDQADAAIAGIVAAGRAASAARSISLVLANDESRVALAATGDGAFADALRSCCEIN